MMQEVKTIKKYLERQELSNKPTLILTRQLKSKIDYLHKMVGLHEWSGELITREEGVITDLDNWKITAEDIYLADIGSPGYTEYTVGIGGFKNNDIIELYETFPELEEGTQKLHHAHSHHSMSAFFSGTDWENLHDRALVSNYFLMLIVNFDGKYCAKVAFRAKRAKGKKTTLSFANNSDGYIPLTLGEDKDDEVLVVMDCKIEMEESIDVPAEFSARFERVKQAIEDDKKKAKEEEEKARKEKYSQKKIGWGGQQQLPFGGSGNWNEEWTPSEHWDSELPWNQYNRSGNWREDWEYNGESGMWERKKEKKISNMTDKEFQQFEADEEAKRIYEQDQQTIVKFGEKHARALLNSIMDGTYRMDNYKDVREPFLALNKELKGHLEMETYMDMWQDMLQEHFDVIYPKASVEKYGELMNVLHEYLKQYKYIRLVKEMLDAVKDEIEMSYHPVIPI